MRAAISQPVRSMPLKPLNDMAQSRAGIWQRIAFVAVTPGAAMGTIQSLGQTPGMTTGNKPYSSVAMMARRVSIPSPFSELVTTISGYAAGCLASAPLTCSITASRSTRLILSTLVRTA